MSQVGSEWEVRRCAGIGGRGREGRGAGAAWTHCHNSLHMWLAALSVSSESEAWHSAHTKVLAPQWEVAGVAGGEGPTNGGVGGAGGDDE